MRTFLARWRDRLAAAATLLALATTTAAAQTPDTLRIGYQRSSTLITLLKTNGNLEKALAPWG